MDEQQTFADLISLFDGVIGELSPDLFASLVRRGWTPPTPSAEETLREVGALSRKPTIGKFQSSNHKHLRETILKLDEMGEREIADTLVWMVWHRENASAWRTYAQAELVDFEASLGDAYAAAHAACERLRGVVADDKPEKTIEAFRTEFQKSRERRTAISTERALAKRKEGVAS